MDDCPRHPELVKYVDSVSQRVTKMYDRLFVILVLVAINLFISGVKVTTDLFNSVMKIQGG